MDSKQVSQVTTGILIIMVGLIMLGGQLRLGLDIGRLWPLALIVLGVSRFVTVGEDGRRGNGGWFLFLGALFLLNNYRILRISESWPLFIVAAGVAMIVGRHEGGGKRRRQARAEAAISPSSGQPGDGSVQS